MAEVKSYRGQVTEILSDGTKEEILAKLIDIREDTRDAASYVLQVKCTQDVEKSLAVLGDRVSMLTVSIDRASRSSTLVGLALIFTGAAAWAYFFLALYRLA